MQQATRFASRFDSPLFISPMRVDRLIEDGKAIHQFADAAGAADAASTARSNARLNLDEGNELTSRNIASSRMAELLGIGDIIAHSEPMKVKMGGKVMTGCFMEFAKGTDLGSKSERVWPVSEPA